MGKRLNIAFVLFVSSMICFLSAGPLCAYDTVRFLEPISAPEMARPAAIAEGNSRLYVFDEKKSSLLIFDAASGKLLSSAGKAGAALGEFGSPRGLAVAPSGEIFVADTGNDRVQVLGPEGRALRAFGSRGSNVGGFKGPRSVAVGADGRVYVADTGNDRVQVFTAEGIFLFAFGSSGKEPGRFKGPTGVAVDAADAIYVLDAGNDRVQKFDPEARLIKELRFEGVTAEDMLVDPYGFLYLLDPGRGKVVEVGSDGAVLGKFGSVGKGPGQFKGPRAIALGEGGLVDVADAGNGRIQRAAVANKMKASPLPARPATKMSVKGPVSAWPIAASALASLEGESLYAYDPDAGQFIVLDAEGRELRRFGTKGKAPEATRGTEGFAASRKSGLFVSDTPNDRVQSFSLDGTWRANIAESSGFFDSRKKEGRVRGPRGVAINEQGTVYVADPGNRRVDAFSPEGFFLFGIGPTLGDYELQEPNAVAWDKDGFVYFTDRELKKVFKCEPSGALLAAFGGEGAGPGQFEAPLALAFDGNSNLYVLDERLKRVSVYSRDGRWVTDLLSGGKEETQLDDPRALAVLGSRLLIADRGKKRVVSFELHPFLKPPVAVSAQVKEHAVELVWQAVADPWALRYRVYRSTSALGPFAEVAATDQTRWRDHEAAAETRYYYRVAAESKTGDIGALSFAAEVFVPEGMNRAPVEISSVAIGNIFSANYKWYLKNPVGRATVANNVNQAFQNVKLTFRLKDFMDFGYDTELPRLDPRARVEVPLIATLNNKILEVSEDTPVQAELTLSYFEGGKPQSVSRTLPLRVYSRNAITWDEPRRVANFVTPKDPPVLEFGREALREAPKAAEAEWLNENLVNAVHLWDALSEAGVSFFTNPSNPYERISEDPNFPVDYTQFPRETLKRKSGQCDDLTTLIVSMLEGAKVRAAILDFPGHMALMFDTETDDPVEAGLPEEDLVFHQGTYWVPLEATMIGKPFGEAAKSAAFAYRTEKSKGKAAVLDVREAWEAYEPVSLPPADWSVPVPPAASRAKRFAAEIAGLFRERYDFLRKGAEVRLKENAKDADALLDLALIEYQAGGKDAATLLYQKILAFEPANAAALNNLGNIYFLSREYASAEAQYLKASEADSQDADIWLNLVKTEVKLKKKDKAREAADMAVALDANLKPAVETLLRGVSDENR